ncbi:MAG TPA: polysaccharide deacetylase family protein [Candidatus Dormibacteraeota bacterium]|nr:polysaccharide deacetylase family protein [Candidatus Dormibacteraeota bacterium]
MSSYSQIFGPYIWRSKTNDKLIALTFDDGPNEPYTSQILDILAEHQIKATFFMVGNCIKRYPEVAKKILAADHSVGNHSVSHKFLNYFRPNFYPNEIIRNQKIFQNYLNITPALYRSPWLWRYPSLLRKLKATGLTAISGEFCHSLEIFQIDSKKIAKAVIRKAKPGAIIIFHDGKEGNTGDRSQTVEAVKLVIKKLIEDNYKFVTIDELLRLQI